MAGAALLFIPRMVIPQAMVEFVEICSSFATVVGMATSPSKPCFGRFILIRPSSRDSYMDYRINMVSSGDKPSNKTEGR